MKKAVVMEKKVTPLKTEEITIVKDQCPIESEIFEDFNLTHCLDCPYLFLGEGTVSHGWYEYKPATVKERNEIEDPDVDITDYYRTIPCAHCGSDVPFHSSYSSFEQGDDSKCPQCGLLHTFLKFEKTEKDSIPVFAIPIKN